MSERSPVVSVVMNCYNGEKYLEQAIASVFAQTYPDWEIVFWDNASEDASARIAKGFDARLRYFRSERTVPLGHARNLALREARGEFIAFLDCDDCWLPEKLSRQMDQFAQRPDLVFAYSNFWIRYEARNAKSPALSGPQPEEFAFDAFLERYPVGMLTAVVRRTALETTESVFDERLNLVEEFDLFLRVAYRGKVGYLPDLLAVYRVHGEMSSVAIRDRWADEYDIVLGKLRALDAVGEHEEAIAAFEANTKRTVAIVALAEGNMRQARTLVAPLKFRHWKFLAVYAASFIPSGLWRNIRGMASRRNIQSAK